MVFYGQNSRVWYTKAKKKKKTTDLNLKNYKIYWSHSRFWSDIFSIKSNIYNSKLQHIKVTSMLLDIYLILVECNFESIACLTFTQSSFVGTVNLILIQSNFVRTGLLCTFFFPLPRYIFLCPLLDYLSLY